MFRSWSQTIARPLGVIELQKWLLRITAFFFKFPKETWWLVLHFRPAGRSQVVISRVLEQNPFLKDCFQNKAPASNYIDIPAIIWRSFSKCIPSISIFLRILARLSVQLWCSAMKNLKFPSLEAKKNNFLITSLQTKGLAWYALLFAVLISIGYCFRCYHDITRSDCVNLLRGQRRDTEIVIADESFQSALEKPLV